MLVMCDILYMSYRLAPSLCCMGDSLMLVMCDILYMSYRLAPESVLYGRFSNAGDV